MQPYRQVLSLVLACLFLAGCALNGVTPRPKRSGASKPGGRPASTAPVLATTGAPAVAPAGVVHLTGKVKLISNHGAAIISNNGGQVIANNGAGVIANNGGGVIANNGGAFRLLAATPESLLAEAEIALLDAAGRPVAGPDGKPLVARTDRLGAYDLKGALPAGNLVMKVRLWSGGELVAILARGGAREASLDVDTASSLGAAFVLDRLVKGEQAVLDKLPPGEATRLQRELEGSRELLGAPPAYDAAGLAAAAEELRRRAPAVDDALKTIEALLLGQRKLGEGQPATQVPLNRPYTVVAAPDGTLTLAEAGLGRLRRITSDGLISTYADAVRGVVKQNFVGMRDLLRLPDGTLYLTGYGERSVYRIGPDHRVEKLYTGDAAIDFHPLTVALGPDGTLYVGGRRAHPENGGRAPIWLAVAPDGSAREMPLIGPGGNGSVSAIVAAPQGGHYMLRVADVEKGGAVFHLPPAGEPRLLADGFEMDENADLQVGADGTLYLTEPRLGRVVAVDRAGGRTLLAGAGVAGAPTLVEPSALGLGPDGTLYVSDLGTARVYARDPAGAWRAIAGVDPDAPLPDGSALPLNSPTALAFDARGRLLITENGRHHVVRFADGRLEPVAGVAEGFAGDEGPASQARFSGLSGMATRGDELFLVDSLNGRLRHVDAAGIVHTLAGTDLPVAAADLPAYPVGQVSLRGALGLALAPDGRPYWADVKRHQIMRLGAPDRVEVVAGLRTPADAPFTDGLADDLADGQLARQAQLRTPVSVAFAPGADGALYVADAGHFQIRKVTGLGTESPRVEAFAGRGKETYGALLGSGGGVVTTGQRLAVDLVIPGGLCFDPQGNMYVGEMGTRRLDLLAGLLGGNAAPDGLPAIPPRIRKITPDGQVSVIAGPGGKFFPDPDAEDALVLPTAVAFAPDGRLVIADPGANLVRILPAGSF